MSVTSDRPTLDTVAAAYAAVVIERQLTVDALLTGPSRVDLDRAVICSDGAEYAVRLLGSARDGRWAWGREHPALAADHPLAEGLDLLPEIGRRHDIPELTGGSVPLTRLPAGGLGPEHTLSVVGCGLLGGRGYHVVTHDGDALHLMLVDRRITPVPVAAEQVPAVLTAGIAAYPYDHRLTVETYLGVRGVPAIRYRRQIVADLGADIRLVVALDDRDQLDAIGFL